MAEVAAVLGCSRRYVFQLSRRRFSRLVVAVLLLALGVNVPNCSVLHTSEIQDTDLQETLPAFTIDEDGGDKGPASSLPLGKIDDIDRLGLQIEDILRGHWREREL